jgi:hypothetical protein
MAQNSNNPAALVIKLMGLTVAVVVAVGLQASERSSHKSDLYGYALSNSAHSPSCAYEFVDLDETGQELTLVAGHPRAAADDRAALLTLARPFELYQSPAQTLVVSENGYLALADSLKVEDGSDFSNDCSLPIRPDNPSATPNRIYVYHDDLRPRADSSVRQAYFTACPRNSAAGTPEPCTVVEWNGFERTGPIPSTQPLRAQAVLYHDSHEVALQYASVDDSAAAQATIGLQGFDGRTARQASCNTRGRVGASQAICFHDPRRPPGGGGTSSVARQ